MDKQAKIHQDKLKNHLTMRLATDEDYQACKTILVETAQWFQANGSTQWSGLLEGIDTHDTKEAIHSGQVYVCMDKNIIAGMVMLLTKASDWDRELWGIESVEDDPAVYLHRLAIQRDYANQQIGQSILDWCLHHISFDNKNVLRLDCVASNGFLNDFYKKAGMKYRGEKNAYSLFEWPYDKD